MYVFRIAVVAGTIALFSGSVSQAQNSVQLAPENGYAVQALVYNVAKNQQTGNYYVTSGNYWRTVGVFPTLESAEDYQEFLLFLAFVDFDKLLLELDLPHNVFVHGYDYRIIPLYSREQLMPRQMILRR